MRLLPSLLERRRLILSIALLMALAGLFSWMTMPREEDPRFPRRKGVLVVEFPGADAETVERLVVEPLEEHLAEVEQIEKIDSTARAAVAILNIEFQDHVYDTDQAWDDVRDAIDEARADFPAGVSEPQLDDDIVEQTAIVLAITGPMTTEPANPLILQDAAETVKRALLSLGAVKKVEEIADPGEQITIEYNDDTARRLDLGPHRLATVLGQRSLIVPGGMIHLGSKTANLRPRTEFRSLREIETTPIVLTSGTSVPLGELARIRRGPREPVAQRMRWNGQVAVALGVVPRYDLDRVAFGRQVRKRLDEIRSEVAPLIMEEVVFQPDMVERRLGQLAGSLKLGIVIVTLVLLVFMGPRLGLLIALLLPLVTFSSLSFFAATGGVLHQISITALVIALGMLVDNAIVVVEAIQWRLDQGTPVRQAAAESVRELALPLGTATGTTLAAFVPLLISKGDTADFTRSIPTLIMLTLSVSYVFAIVVTPVLSELFLRPRATRREKSFLRPAFQPGRLARFAVHRPVAVIGMAALLLVLTLASARFVDRKFFPPAERNEVMIDLEMPEGTHLGETDAVARRLEDALRAHPDIATVASFVGRAAPHFYYNLLPRPRSPHRAEIVATTKNFDNVEPMMQWVLDFAHRHLPEAEVITRRLEQGPPVSAPVEVRILGDDLGDLEEVSEAVRVALREVPGTREVRDDLGLGVPTVTFEINDTIAARHGLSRADVARTLYGRTLGLTVGQFRMDEDPIPIVLRAAAGQRLEVSRLETLDISAPEGRTPGGRVPIPLSQLARREIEWRPAAIHHHQRSRVVRVRSELTAGADADDVLNALRPRLAELELPPGVRLGYGGEIEASGEANTAILRTLPLGLLLLLFFLLAEFNSFRRLGIVMVTVPLAATGVVPGLLLAGQPFGFMSILGIISLVGIVVNNAIVLLDVIDRQRQNGASVDDALVSAVERRARPILLTMATTVAGLTPLAFSAATLWPPLAWAMISGLTASTVLTLVVVPALYKLLI